MLFYLSVFFDLTVILRLWHRLPLPPICLPMLNNVNGTYLAQSNVGDLTPQSSQEVYMSIQTLKRLMKAIINWLSERYPRPE